MKIDEVFIKSRITLLIFLKKTNKPTSLKNSSKYKCTKIQLKIYSLMMLNMFCLAIKSKFHLLTCISNEPI